MFSTYKIMKEGTCAKIAQVPSFTIVLFYTVVVFFFFIVT